MPVFIWEGINKQGIVKKGEKDAPNEAAVIKFLRSQNIRAQKISRKSNSEGFKLKLPFGGGVPEKDVVIFARQFATMIDAGLPLVKCLDILHKQQPNKNFRSCLKDVQNSVESGSTFADALGKHPKVFDDLFVNLVGAGEVGGALDVIFARIAAYLEKAMKLKKNIKGAMVYPVSILIVAIVVVIALLVYVIPVFEAMFKNFGNAELPAITQFVIDASRGFMKNWYIFLIIVVGSFVSFKKFVSTKKGRYAWDSFTLKLPIIGPLIIRIGVARFTRTLATMLTSGVPILEAMDVVSRTAGNVIMKEAILFAKNSIKDGNTIADPLKKSKVFPSMVAQMIEVGESSGSMDTMLGKIADFYEDEVDTAVAALTSLLEPIMMVFLGGLIGGVVLAMYLPVFSMAGAIQEH